jgi:PAS domain S-box-containing protein
MEANERARILIDQSPDAIILADLNGIIVEWNAAAESVFGHPASEAVGQSLDLIVPERFREAHWAGYDRALAAGDTKYRGQTLPTRSMRKDGSDIYVELTFSIVHSRDGDVIGALAHARDISERWAREREQRQSLRELEAKGSEHA